MIVVTTPTGQIGSQVLDRLLDAPEDTGGIRVIVRDSARLSARARDRVEVVQGSHADPAALKEACAGADRVFWLVPPTPGADTVEGHFRAFTEPMCEVIGQQGVERVVGVSTLGRGVAKNAGQISASLAADDAIAATGVHYRALCAPFLMENLLHQAQSIRDAGCYAWHWPRTASCGPAPPATSPPRPPGCCSPPTGPDGATSRWPDLTT